MRRIFSCALTFAVLTSASWVVEPVWGQQTQQNNGVGGQTNAGLTQTGQSEAFTIVRNEAEAVNSATTNFLSRASAPGTSGTTYGRVEGFGSLGGSSGSTLSSLGLGGRGGLGGGLGGGAFGIGAGIGLGSQFGTALGGGGRATQQGVAGTSSSTLPLRHRIRVDVGPPARAISRISQAFAKRLTRLPGLKGLRSVDVTMAGQTAVLTGSVDSERTRDLVARLAMLEPGIAAVRNELSVETTAAPPNSLQPPSP